MLNKKEKKISPLGWIFKRTRRYLPLVAFIALISMIDAAIFIWLALLSKQLLDVATGAVSGSTLKAGISIFAVIFGHIVIMSLHSFAKTYASAKLTISMRNHIFSSVSRKKYSEISGYHSGELLNRITSDSDVIISSVVSIIPSIASIVAKIVGGMWALLTLDWRIAVITVCLGLCVPAIGRVLNRKYKSLHKLNQQTEGKTRSFMQECFENIVVVKTFASEAPFTKKLGQLMRENFVVKIKRALISLVTHMSLYSFFTIGYYFVMVWGAGQISKGAITYGTLMAFLQLISQLRAPLQNVSGIIPQYYSAVASAERIMEIEGIDEDKPSLTMKKLNKIKKEFSGISVNGITFAYKDEPILKDCNFTAEKGKITAITGESGSGKSTIFRVILGLYEPQDGEILINGDIKLDTSLRGLFAYVPQGNLVLSGTLRENLTLCNDDVAEDELIKAAKAADIYDLIESLPDGFDTVVSERGGGLSEGQIQRISIARALLTDAPVLLLDEATSALDESTETTVLSNIKAMKEKTVLFVTHRNTSLKVCDKIIRVEDKKFNVIKE